MVFLVIPMFFILGYNYRIIKIATEGMINGDDELPEFENWTLMLVAEGIKCFVVYLGYFDYSNPCIFWYSMGLWPS